MFHITWVSRVWLFRFQTITGVICHQKQCEMSSRIKKVNVHPRKGHKEPISIEPWDPVNSILGTMSVCLEGGGGDSRFTESVDTLLCCDIGLAILICKRKSPKKRVHFGQMNAPLNVPGHLQWRVTRSAIPPSTKLTLTRSPFWWLVSAPVFSWRTGRNAEWFGRATRGAPQRQRKDSLRHPKRKPKTIIHENNEKMSNKWQNSC